MTYQQQNPVRSFHRRGDDVPACSGGQSGNSAANDTASRARLPLRFPNEEGGIYDAHSSSQIRYKIGMDKDEFEAFYEDTFLDAEGNRLARSSLFGQARNHLGNYSAEDNKARLVIRGSMDDRDRVLCWLEMLRRDTLFEDMALAYRRCAGTNHNGHDGGRAEHALSASGDPVA
ncbi:unnamed protein product [Ectocarpus sp. CCAP 1310/34]|nr:unnamed protein product [Ectocarpus sp. CCAP 1310/34]